VDLIICITSMMQANFVFFFKMSGGNDISLIYPWVHVSSESSDIALWIQRYWKITFLSSCVVFSYDIILNLINRAIFQQTKGAVF
jgi:hypothetical protein